MLKNSSKFFEAFDGEERSDLSVRLTINGQVYSNQDIFSINYDSGSMQGDQLEIGSSYSNSIKVTFCDTITTFKELDKVVVELGIKRQPLDTGIISGDVSQVGFSQVGYAPLNAYKSAEAKVKFDVRGRFAKAGLMYMNRWNAQEEYEYSRMGEFYISEQIDVNWNEKTTSLECSDALVFTESAYSTTLDYPAQLRDIAREVGENVGLTLDYINYDELPDISLGKLTGELTNRQALEKLSHFVIGYVKINRFGYLELKSFVETNYVVDPTYYFSKGLSKNEIRYKIGGITCTVESSDESGELHSGSYVGSQITIENNLMTQAKLDSIYNKLSTISYYPYSLSWRGNPALEVGDYITVSDLSGNIYKVPNISYSLEFNGSLKGTSKAETASMTDIVSNSNSPLLNKITKTVNQVKKDNILISEKINEVNEKVVEVNRAIENTDIEGVKNSLADLLIIAESFVHDIEETNSKINGFNIPELEEIVEQIKGEIEHFPIYTNVTLQNDGLFTKENYQIFLNHINYFNEIMNGTGWVNLTSSYTSEFYTPRFRNRNKRVELQFSLKGFTAEGQIAITLPEGSRSQRLLQKYLFTLDGKTAIVSIGTDGTVKISKVFGSPISSTDVFTLDIEFPID